MVPDTPFKRYLRCRIHRPAYNLFKALLGVPLLLPPTLLQLVEAFLYIKEIRMKDSLTKLQYKNIIVKN